MSPVSKPVSDDSDAFSHSSLSSIGCTPIPPSPEVVRPASVKSAGVETSRPPVARELLPSRAFVRLPANTVIRLPTASPSGLRIRLPSASPSGRLFRLVAASPSQVQHAKALKLQNLPHKAGLTSSSMPGRAPAPVRAPATALVRAPAPSPVRAPAPAPVRAPTQARVPGSVSAAAPASAHAPAQPTAPHASGLNEPGAYDDGDGAGCSWWP
jgi:hypothetical protein